MELTNELRFVKRQVKVPYVEGATADNQLVFGVQSQTRMILQQKWREDGVMPHGRTTPRKEEWRDVPVEDES